MGSCGFGISKTLAGMWMAVDGRKLGACKCILKSSMWANRMRLFLGWKRKAGVCVCVRVCACTHTHCVHRGREAARTEQFSPHWQLLNSDKNQQAQNCGIYSWPKKFRWNSYSFGLSEKKHEEWSHLLHPYTHSHRDYLTKTPEAQSTQFF